MKNALAKEKNTKYIFVLIVLIITVCFLCVKLFFPGKKTFHIFGYSFFIVSSSSMEPEYPVNTLIIVKNESFESLKAGDAIAYKSDALGGGLAFHRINRITENGLYTKGDNNPNEDNQLITKTTYVGKMVLYSYHSGRYISMICNPAGFIVFFLFPLLAVYLACLWFKRFIKIWKN